MAKYKPQRRRLIQIDQEFQQARQIMLREERAGGAGTLTPQPLPNCKSLAEKLEVSPKTIQRDIEWLRTTEGAPIEYDAVRHGYYYAEANYHLPAIQINESDLFAICIAERALEQYRDTPLYKKLREVFGRIESSLPETVTLHPAWVDKRISFFETPPRKLNPVTWQTMTRALREGRGVSIIYRGARTRTPEHRSIDPYHMIHYRGEWYVLAYCHKRNDLRNFAVSRIQRAEKLRRKFSIPESFDPAKLFAESGGIMWGSKVYNARIRFNAKAAAAAIEREWHRGQKVHENKDGSVVLSFEASHLGELKSWLLSWGSQAKVLAPKELVEMMREESQQMAKAYGSVSGAR